MKREKINIAGTDIDLIVMDDLPSGKIVFVNAGNDLPVMPRKDDEGLPDLNKLREIGFVDVQVFDIPSIDKTEK